MSAEIIKREQLEFEMESLYPAEEFCFRMEALRLLNSNNLGFQQYAIRAVEWASKKSKDTMIGFLVRENGFVHPSAFQLDFDEAGNFSVINNN